MDPVVEMASNHNGPRQRAKSCYEKAKGDDSWTGRIRTGPNEHTMQQEEVPNDQLEWEDRMRSRQQRRSHSVEESLVVQGEGIL